MNEADIRRLSELRSLLEGFAARHAAQHVAIAREHLGRLRASLEKVRDALSVRDYSAFREADFELHKTIVEMSRVPRLLVVWQEAWDGLLGFHEQGFNDYFPDARVLAEEHEHLVETIALADPVAAEDAARSHVEAVWYRVAERASLVEESTRDPLRRATAHLAFCFHRPLSLTEIAQKIAFTSPGNLSRLFRSHHGMSFQAYLQKLRLEKAAELLSSTRLPIARIAKRVGYRDVSRFGQHFKRLYGKAPSTWRSCGTTVLHSDVR